MKEQRKADIAKAVSLDYNEIKFYYRQGMRGIMINKIAVYSRSFYQEISLPTVSEQSTSFRIEQITGKSDDPYGRTGSLLVFFAERPVSDLQGERIVLPAQGGSGRHPEALFSI